MLLIVGLGNPGAEYESTFHNAGFMVADALAASLRVQTRWVRSYNGLYITAQVAGESLGLLKPQTFMNLSGKAVQAALSGLCLTTESLVVIHDDVDIPEGRLKLKKGGGTGGHRGLESITETLGRDDYLRVRIGVGRPPQFVDTAQYVLSAPDSGRCAQALDATVKAGAQAVQMLVRRGLGPTMNSFNNKDFAPADSPEDAGA